MMKTGARAIAGMVTLVAVAGAIALTPAPVLAQSTQRSKSLLDRNKTKLKPPPVGHRGPRPLPDLKPGTNAPRLPLPHPSQTTGGATEAPAVRGALIDVARQNRGGDLDIGVGETTATISPVFQDPAGVTGNQAYRAVLEARRDGRAWSTGEDLQRTAGGDVNAFNEARDQYLSQGYQEVRMNDHDVVFVRSSDPEAVQSLSSALQDRISETAYLEWRDDWNRWHNSQAWVYSDTFGRQSSGPGTPSPTPMLDSFVLRVTLHPEKPLSADELAELDMSDIELADKALLSGDTDLAIERYESYLKDNPEDAGAVRSLGVALLNGRRFAEGITRVAHAYALDPTLASDPIDIDFLGGDRNASALVQRVVPLAHKSAEPDPAIVAVVIMQAEGRLKEAARMLERARERGLSGAVLREMTLALTTPPQKQTPSTLDSLQPPSTTVPGGKR